MLYVTYVVIALMRTNILMLFYVEENGLMILPANDNFYQYLLSGRTVLSLFGSSLDHHKRALVMDTLVFYFFLT